MKKFMKAIAFVTVMCMALSTVAFAATGAVLDENAAKVLNITVEGATGDEQVALMIVPATAADNDFSTPLYVDQKPAVSGTATFRAVLTNAEVAAVDVYVGYSTWATDHIAANKIGNDVALEKAITEVTVVKVNADAVQGGEAEGLKAQEQTGAGVWGEFSVTAPEGVEASQMIWAIRYADKVKYSDAIDVADYHIGNMVSGSIKLGFAFLNGSELKNIDPVTITAVDAIFLFVGEDFEDQEVLTNPADAEKKAK